MIAPDARVGKRLQKKPTRAATPRGEKGCCGCDTMTGRHHRFVNRIILLPNCRQAHAQLKWDQTTVASGPGLSTDAGFLSPPAPRSSGWIGPNPHQDLQSVACKLLGRLLRRILVPRSSVAFSV